MALVIYPDTNYNSFCSVLDADTIIAEFIQSSQRADWEAKATADKETLLRQSTLLIKGKIDELPETLEDELKQACALLANYSVDKDMTNESDTHLIKKKKADDIEKEYFNVREPENAFPDIVISLLSKYEVKPSGSFVFVRA